MEHHTSQGKCRFCQAPLETTFVDLGMAPMRLDYVRPNGLNRIEPFYPLHAYVCNSCFLVQLEDVATPSEILNDYADYSSYSDNWLQQAKAYVDQISERLQLRPDSLVAELSTNGSLLQHFVDKKIPVLGIDPTMNAEESGGDKREERHKFFGLQAAHELKEKYGAPDLLVGNNVLSHAPDINDFVSGMKAFLGVRGVITVEFPHLLKLVERNQFDNIFHDHFSYLSFTTVEKIFKYHGLTIFDVEELPAHGGSLRIYARHREDVTKNIMPSVLAMLAQELEAGMLNIKFYTGFEKMVRATKMNILEFFIEAKSEGKTIVGYGAPGKGNTLLNYCGVRRDFIDYTVDGNPEKQGNFLPGTLIPICNPGRISETRPDYVFILPWDLKDEIMENMSFIHEWGGKFVIPIPELKVLDSRWMLQRYKRAS